MRSSRGNTVFTASRFVAIAGPAAIRQALSRLTKAGKIRRVRQGLYDLPRRHPIIGQTAPDVTDTVRTLMKGSQARWEFSGAYAANLLGLSDQVPAKIVILTDGVPRSIKLGNLTLAFRRAAPRNLLGAGGQPGLVFQALRYLKGSGLGPDQVARLRKQLGAKTKSELKRLTPHMPVWLRPIVQQITQR